MIEPVPGWRRPSPLDVHALDDAGFSGPSASERDVMDSLLQDLRYALRTFRRNPGFATIAVLTLALGIGANTTIFSAISTLLLNAMPFPEAERLAHVQLVHPNGTTTPATYEEFEAWRDEAEVFERAAAYTYRDFN